MNDIAFGGAEVTAKEFRRIAPGYLDTFKNADEYRWKLVEHDEYIDDRHPWRHLYGAWCFTMGRWMEYGWLLSNSMNMGIYNIIMTEASKRPSVSSGRHWQRLSKLKKELRAYLGRSASITISIN